MNEKIIYFVFTGIGIYLLFGLLFTIFFITKGLNKVDEGAHGSGIGFKLIIVPGCTVFWPLLLKKWRNLAIKKDSASN